MEKVKLGEIFEYLPKSKFKAGDGKEEGKYKFFTSSNVQNKFIDRFIYDGEYLIFGTGGKASINYCNDKFSTSTDNFVVKVNNEFNAKLIFLYFKNNMEILEKGFKGASIKHISKEYINQLEIPKYNCQHQINIVNKLDKVQDVIDMRKKQIEKFDELIKSQFVEMFGSVKNSKWSIEKLESITEKITDGKHGGCQSEDNSGYYFIGATEIYNDKINYENSNQITKKDFEKDYTRCDLQLDDFVIVNTGATIGKSAIVVDERCKKTLLQKSVALIRVKKERLLPIYLKYCYEEEPSLYNKGQGCARINLLLSQIKNTDIPIPPIELQKKFAEFVKQIDKQKFEIQKSLEEMQKLQESLMNKYFGG